MLGFLWKHKLKIVLFVFVLCLVAVPLVSYVGSKYILLPQIHFLSTNLESHYSEILADLKLIDQSSMFANQTSNRNAEDVLAKYISWQGEGVTKSTLQNYDYLEKIFDQYPKWRTSKEQLRNMASDTALHRVDTTWVQDLQNYDHWNFSNRNEILRPIQKIAESNAVSRIEIFSKLPLPNYRELRNWAILNFLKLRQERKAIEGLQNYRKVAQLIHSSGTLAGNMMAATMLRDESVFVSTFSISKWTPISENTIEAYKRVSWAWVDLIRTPFFGNFPEQFAAYLKPQNGVCAGSWETASGFSLFLDLFEPKVAFETDFSVNINNAATLHKKLLKDCNQTTYNSFLERSPASANPILTDHNDQISLLTKENLNINAPLNLNWIRIPYMRRLVGLSLFTSGVANYHAKYYPSLSIAQQKDKKF